MVLEGATNRSLHTDNIAGIEWLREKWRIDETGLPSNFVSFSSGVMLMSLRDCGLC